ncbi:MAG TPA: adenylate/guanylate cyclase domain-containing protein [Casimicrobiaceae bacterium]|nr:adenylate/guanylate cyclase domain-containing protein [Casimicrobiaceae bacterium]
MDSAPRNLAVLFADVAGSTKLYETLGDAEALQTIGRCLDIMKSVCEEHGGRVVKTIGDEAMVVFPLPANAAYAAIAMQNQISVLRTSKGAPLSIHAGFHFGPVIDDGADVFGDSVNVAARLTSLAKAGQTLISAETVQVLSPSLRARTRDQDSHTVRGKQDDVHTFELIWQESEEELTAVSTRPASKPIGIRLTHGARELDLDQNSAPITLGRDAQNDVVIMDRKASRLHARIERRRDKFVIVDVSSNGTFCTVNDEPEIMLRREELILRGSGRISFGHAFAEDAAEAVLYSCI